MESWQLDELGRAGPEHRDPAYVSTYDAKSPTDWRDDIETLRTAVGPTGTVIDLGAGTGAFALALAPHVGRVIAVDVSPAMVHLMRSKGIKAVQAGLLSYEHDGEPADAVYSRHALHHLPDFWKAIALQRIARILEPGGLLLLRDLIFSFELAEVDSTIAAWLAAAPADARTGWTAEQLAEHVREEHSTFTWLLEPMLERAGFAIEERSLTLSGMYAAYTCRVTGSR
jgi:ubiquinone/menaquinone biosynthesis C-methylase UbiE